MAQMNRRKTEMRGVKASTIFSNRGKGIPVRHASKGCLAAVLAVLMGSSVDMGICRAQQHDLEKQSVNIG
jgi:hypothetical protein